ncbi:hypothetical protein EJB05_34246 [Eragrostis curvula]|uniref:Uncharacterized protein n=1 Tax=Eragrostis curvula TaxID=38414 RepID=A0A5J9U4J6_9POAL|nr:hypothetical protein EJB05_34246 [Eragrostis curvula]
MSAGANGQFKTYDLHYVQLRERTQEWSQRFIEYCLKVLQHIKNGRLHDSHSEPEMDMSNEDTSSAPAAKSKGKECKASKQPFTDDRSRIKPVDFLEFIPEILESSHVKPYDPESGGSVLSYPSVEEKKRQSEQARLSTLTLDDTLAKFEKVNQEITEEPDFSSSTAFKQLCSLDKSYRGFARRITSINKKIGKLEGNVRKAGRTGRFKIMEKLETFLQEKEDLFDMITMGLDELENNDDDEAGPSES